MYSEPSPGSTPQTVVTRAADGHPQHLHSSDLQPVGMTSHLLVTQLLPMLLAILAANAFTAEFLPVEV